MQTKKELDASNKKNENKRHRSTDRLEREPLPWLKNKYFFFLFKMYLNPTKVVVGKISSMGDARTAIDCFSAPQVCLTLLILNSFFLFKV